MPTIALEIQILRIPKLRFVTPPSTPHLGEISCFICFYRCGSLTVALTSGWYYVALHDHINQPQKLRLRWRDLQNRGQGHYNREKMMITIHHDDDEQLFCDVLRGAFLLSFFQLNDKLFKRCFMNWILFSLPLDFVQLEQFFLLLKVAIWWLQGNTTAQTAHCAFNLCFVPDPPSLNIFALGPLWSNNMQNSFPRANGFESNHERGSLKGREWYFLSIEPHLHAS